jgi:thioesterase domain-containing protein
LRLIGHSFGGNLAFELALALHCDNLEVELVLIDCILATPSVSENQSDGLDLLTRKQVGAMLAKVGLAKVGQPLAGGVTPTGQEIDWRISERDIDAYVEAVAEQLSLADVYCPSGIFTGAVTLVVAKEGIANAADHDRVIQHIQSYCRQTIKIVVASGTHRSVIDSVDLVTTLCDEFGRSGS